MWLTALLVAHAQVPEDRIDHVVQRALPAPRAADWAVLPVGEQGLIAYTQRPPEARRYDANLREQWTVALPEVVDDVPRLTRSRGDAAWAVFERGPLAVVTRHRIASGDTRAWIVPLDSRRRRVVDFDVAGNDAWLVTVGGPDVGGGVHHLDLDSGVATSVALPPVAGPIALQRISAQPSRGFVDVAYRTSLGGRFTQHVAVARRGQLVHDVVLQLPGINLLDVQRQFLDNGDQLVVGTYAATERGSLASGWYAARLDRDGQPMVVTTHPFGALDPALPDGAVRFATHDVQRDGEHLVISGEIYAPRVPFLMMSPSVQAREVDGGIQAEHLDTDLSDGWWFTHAVVAAFGPSGERAWHAAVRLRNVKGYRIEPHVRVGVHQGAATLAYTVGDTMVSHTYDQGEAVLGPVRRDLGRPVRKHPLTAQPWYGDQWLVSGLQRQPGPGHRFVLSRLQTLTPGAGAGARAGAGAPPRATLRPAEATRPPEGRSSR